jgi:Protein of unknown function (DUF3618)
VGEDPSTIREEIEETRARMGDTVEAIGYKTDVKSRAKDSVQSKIGGVRQRMTGAKHTVSDKTPSGDDVKQVVGVAQENPLGLGIAAFAGGFLIGMLIPSTDVENERLGRASTQVKEQAKQTAQEAVEHGKQVAQEVASTAAETAKEKGQEHAEELKGSAQESAQRVRP